jgi:hypothetical protein
LLLLLLFAQLIACAEQREPGRGAEASGPSAVAGKSVIETGAGLAVKDEYVLIARRPWSQQELDESLRQRGGSLLWLSPAGDLALVRVAPDDLQAAAHACGAREVVRNRVMEGTGIGTTPSVTMQWNIPAIGMDEGDMGRADGVVIALLDSGVTHAPGTALENATLLTGYDFVDDDAEPLDDSGHGTHLASLLVGEGVLRALAPGASILPIKVLDGSLRGTELGLALGIDYAIERGVDVINLSLAFPAGYVPSRFLQSRIGRALRSGVVVVAAAGNDGREAVSYPAAFRSVIAVGANQLAALEVPGGQAKGDDPWRGGSLKTAPYSNSGPGLDLLAPGGSLFDDLSGDGIAEGILAQSYDPATGLFEYENRAGTSQAAAHATAAAALLIAERGLVPGQVRRVLGKAASRDPQDPIGEDGQGNLDLWRAERLGLGAYSEPMPIYAVVGLGLEDSANGRRAVAGIDVLDTTGRRVKNAEVFVSFTGGTAQTIRAITDKKGHIEVRSELFADDVQVVGAQVDAVVLKEHGHRVERAMGALRLDSCSLRRVMAYGASVTAASGKTSGTGIGTTPSAPMSVVSPSSDEVSATLMNFSWLLSSAPMAVAVDDSWWQQSFTDAAVMRIVNTGTDGRLMFGEQAFAEPTAVDTSECVDLVVRTFAGGMDPHSYVPLLVDRDSSGDAGADAKDAVIREAWFATASGEALQSWTESSGVSEETFYHLQEIAAEFADFSEQEVSTPLTELPQVMEVLGQSPLSP